MDISLLAEDLYFVILFSDEGVVTKKIINKVFKINELLIL